MRVLFTIVGTVERHDNVWAELEAVPVVGDTVELPGISLFVRTVVWYPLGDNEAEGDAYKAPFVYVVLGQQRPHT